MLRVLGPKRKFITRWSSKPISKHVTKVHPVGRKPPHLGLRVRVGNLSGHSGQRERTKKEERGRGDSLPTPRSEKEKRAVQ